MIRRIRFIICFSFLVGRPLFALDHQLIPEPLNSILPRITAGMKVKDILPMLTKSYPKVKQQVGDWSGQSGYVDFQLDERYTISFAAHSSLTGAKFLSDDVRTYLFDGQLKNRIEITRYQWDAVNIKH